jgi:hypothetical protein
MKSRGRHWWDVYHEGKQMDTAIKSENLKRRYYFGGVGSDGRMIKVGLKNIVRGSGVDSTTSK